MAQMLNWNGFEAGRIGPVEAAEDYVPLLRLCLMFLLSLSAISAASADVVHKIRFAQKPVVMVWDDGGATALHGEIVDVPLGASKVEVSGLWLGSGRLIPISNNHLHTMPVAGPDLDSAVQTYRFKVASNAPITLQIRDERKPQSLHHGAQLAAAFRVVSHGEAADPQLISENSDWQTLYGTGRFETPHLAVKTALKSGDPHQQSVTLALRLPANHGPVTLRFVAG